MGATRFSFVSQCTTPLGQEEMPKKGDLVAIDAEFVCGEDHLCARGGHDGGGPLHWWLHRDPGEEVVDYLTKFSGLKPGDLTTLNSTITEAQISCLFVTAWKMTSGWSTYSSQRSKLWTLFISSIFPIIAGISWRPTSRGSLSTPSRTPWHLWSSTEIYSAKEGEQCDGGFTRNVWMCLSCYP